MPKRYRHMRADESRAASGHGDKRTQRKGEIKGTGKVSSGILAVRTARNVFSKAFPTGQILQLLGYCISKPSSF